IFIVSRYCYEMMVVILTPVDGIIRWLPRGFSCSPALMPELLVLALAAAGRVPDDGCFAAAAAHNVVVSKNIQD
ncbi:hypothetical protein, partial [Klebsiella aerogenes]|uniref:hypothetical protein n=2 Tax=Klebsiella TaxID=570 RepID=UPI004032A347